MRENLGSTKSNFNLYQHTTVKANQTGVFKLLVQTSILVTIRAETCDKNSFLEQFSAYETSKKYV